MMMGGKKAELAKMKSDLSGKIGRGEPFTDAEIGVALSAQTDVIAHLLAAVEGLMEENKSSYQSINGQLKEIRQEAWKHREEDLRRYPNPASLKIIAWLASLVGAGLFIFSSYLWTETQKAKEIDAVQNRRLDVHERVNDNHEKRIEQLERERRP